MSILFNVEYLRMSILFCIFVVQMAIVSCVTTNKYSYMETTNVKKKKRYYLTFIGHDRNCVELCVECAFFIDAIHEVQKHCNEDDYKVIIQRETLINGVVKLPVVAEIFPSNLYLKSE